MRVPDENNKVPEQPIAAWPFGWSGRLFGAACLAFGVVVLVANAAVLILWNRYWRGLFLLPPVLVLFGLVLVLLPERLTRFDVRSRWVGGLMLAAVVAGLAVGGVLAYDPAGVFEQLGLARTAR